MSDLISRAEAIRIAEQGQVQGFEWQFKKLCDLPSVKPRKGKWLKAYGDHEAFGIRPFYRYCSECNEATVFPYNFCPNCGADMRGEQE